MTERLVVAHIGHRGDGIADTAEGPVYIPCTLPGETVETEPFPGHPDRRLLLRIVEPSPDRIAPICPHFGTCGGCALQHWAEPHYRAWKRDLVVSALDNLHIEAPVGELIDAHGEGRRRMVLHARRGSKDVLEVGFSALRSHIIVPIDRCPVLAPGLEGAIPIAWTIAETLRTTEKPLDIQMTATDTGLDIDVRGSGALNARTTAALARVAESGGIARITRHGELVTQRRVPTVQMGRASVPIPPGSFLQATARGEAVLGALVAEHLGRPATVADLFSGAGPFALRLAERARILAVDNDELALDALSRAARATSGLKPIETQRRDLFRRPLMAQELKKTDAVVFDPPRDGAQAQARELAKSNVPLAIAVSCNAATFARDARILIDGGYRLSAVTPVDQFRYTAHVEIVAKFMR
ncbi:MAG: class I SAM-dependent RNA methyltransferase [Pseudorhodoplanes sp.]|nr:class I SAM-dependent RNA methyltransferase [Pseudorhodoplanes sp.]